MNTQDMDDIGLLTALVMGEAEAESLLGKIAVAHVVKNRLISKKWGRTLKAVILQRKQFSCFTESAPWFRPEILEEHPKNIIWRECRWVASGILNDCIVDDPTKGSNHYYSTDIAAPYWAKKHTPMATIGKHKFFIL